MIKEIETIIQTEENDDAAARAQYGAQWTRAPSSQLNGQYKTVVQQSQ
jgi:hypothetical protein